MQKDAQKYALRGVSANKSDVHAAIKNMDKGYDFMPRHAKQIGARQAIVPCQYRGFTCFAKIEF